MKKTRHTCITPNPVCYHYCMSQKQYDEIVGALKEEKQPHGLNDVIRYLNDTVRPLRKITNIRITEGARA